MYRFKATAEDDQGKSFHFEIEIDADDRDEAWGVVKYLLENRMKVTQGVMEDK